MALGLLVSACASESGGDATAAPTRGAVVFAENCSVCHEVDGTGRITNEGTRLAPSLHGVAEKYPVSKHIEIVTFGGQVIQGGSMPAWGRLLSPQDIEAVVEYERTTFVDAG